MKYEYDKNSKTDINGYVIHWDIISRDYRNDKNYTCEKCGIRPELEDEKYIHCHHIDGNKLDNRSFNIECLCILCHAFTDSTHIKNATLKDLENFIDDYRDALQKNK